MGARIAGVMDETSRSGQEERVMGESEGTVTVETLVPLLLTIPQAALSR